MRGQRASQLAVVALVMATACSSGSRPDAAPGPGAAEVTVDLAAQRQRMGGFGVSARVFSDPHLAGSPTVDVPPAAREEILRWLFGDLRLTRMRSVLDPGLEATNDNRDPSVLETNRLDYAGKRSDDHAALARDATRFGLRTFFAAPVTTEPWMDDGDVDEYVEWAMAQLERWRAFGAEPAFYSPLNERSARGERGQEWYVAVVKTLGRRMRAAGLATRLVVSDDLNPKRTYPTAAAVLADPEARGYVGALAYHLYGGDAEARRRIAELGRTYELPVWMTEYGDGSYGTWPGAVEWAATMSRLITEDGVSAIDYLWGFFGARDDEQTLVSLQFENGRFVRASRRAPYAVMGQFSRFIPPGAVRVATTSSVRSLAASAYTTPAGDAVVVLVNTARRRVSASVAVRGGALRGPVRATASSADGTESRAVATDDDRRFTAELVAAGVTTFVVPVTGGDTR